MESAIEIHNLTKSFGDRRAVDDLTLEIPKGQLIAFLGPNGAGKTTTIKMLCGLVTPDSGQARLNGFDVRRQKGQAMGQIGAVLEGTRNVYWRLSVWQNITYFGRLKGVWGRSLKDRAESLLKELGLWERRHDKLRTFSRGMQQKVAIACALVSDPPIILLDEPTLGLDVEAALTVKALVKRLSEEEGKTILLTTHQLDLAEELADRVAIIREGQLVMDRPTDEVLAAFGNQSVYEIRVGADVNGHASIFDGYSVVSANNETVITGSFNDQDQLLQVIERARTVGGPILSVSRSQPDLEDVFLELVAAENSRI